MRDGREETTQDQGTVLVILCSLRPTTHEIIFISITSTLGWVVLFVSLISRDCLVKLKE
jgi:hypothetical protein